MAIGKADIYIITTKETWTAGWSAPKEVIEKPAVRVEAIWNRPSTRRRPGEKGLLWGFCVGDDYLVNTFVDVIYSVELTS